MKTRIAGAACILLALAVAGCGKVSEPYKDAERGSTNNDKADTLTFPDGFSNVATKCDHGNRVYVIFKGDSTYGGIAVAPNDPSCADD